MTDEPSKPLDGIIRTLQQRKHRHIFTRISRTECLLELPCGNKSARKVHGKLIIKRSKRNLAAVASAKRKAPIQPTVTDGKPGENSRWRLMEYRRASTVRAGRFERNVSRKGRFPRAISARQSSSGDRAAFIFKRISFPMPRVSRRRDFNARFNGRRAPPCGNDKHDRRSDRSLSEKRQNWTAL